MTTSNTPATSARSTRTLRTSVRAWWAHPPAEGVIEDAKFKTYGCGSAIASSSLVSEWVKGKTLEEAGKITNAQIADELALPPVKIHCSILAEDAVKAAIADYRAKQHPAEQDAKKE